MKTGRPKSKDPKDWRLNLRLQKRAYIAIEFLAKSTNKSMGETIDSLLTYAILVRTLFNHEHKLPTKEQMGYLKDKGLNVSPEIFQLLERLVNMDKEFEEFSNMYLSIQHVGEDF